MTDSPAAPDNMSRLSKEAEELAGTASRMLSAALADGDAKRARELAAIFKDMAALARELSGGGSQSLTVRFEGGTDEAGV